MLKPLLCNKYRHFLHLKKSNQRIQYLSQTKETISQQIVLKVAELQQSQSKAQSNDLSMQLDHLHDLHKQLTHEYTTLLQKELEIVHQNWPGLFEKIIEGVDRQTLEHVLTVYEQYQSGNINQNEAVTQGIEYMTTKYQLPDDFFDKNAIDQFNQNLHNDEN